MESFSVSVLCTREEYMRFRSHGTTHWWVMVTGVVLLALGVAGLAFDITGSALAALLLLCGVMTMMAEPLLLPFLRRGDAARAYDASDSLQQALALTFEEDAVTLKSAHVSGRIPLSAVTATARTADMLALFCGQELTLLLPRRVLTEEQYTALSKRLP